MLPESLHVKLNEYIRKYFILGGMPAVVQEYCETGDMISCQRIQRAIVDTYQDDFGKYSKKLKQRNLNKIYNAVPKMVGRKFVYAHVYGKVPGAAGNKNFPGALRFGESNYFDTITS
jgi:hypothetical protein